LLLLPLWLELLLPLWLELLLPLWLELGLFASARGGPSFVVLSFTAHHLRSSFDSASASAWPSRLDRFHDPSRFWPRSRSPLAVVDDAIGDRHIQSSPSIPSVSHRARPWPA